VRDDTRLSCFDRENHLRTEKRNGIDVRKDGSMMTSTCNTQSEQCNGFTVTHHKGTMREVRNERFREVTQKFLLKAA
jgi:hypothetical protein